MTRPPSPAPARKTALQPPHAPDGAAAAALPDDVPVARESYANLRIDQADWRGAPADHVSLERAALAGVTWRDAALPHLRLKDVRLERCDLANADWYGLVAHRVALIGCRLVGLRAGEAHLTHVLVRDCQAALTSWRFAATRTVRFERCDLRDADFQGADLSGVVFLDCDLTQVEFSGARLAGADLRGSRLDGIRLGVAELRGAIVDPLQAVGLIRLLGVIVDATRVPSTE